MLQKILRLLEKISGLATIIAVINIFAWTMVDWFSQSTNSEQVAHATNAGAIFLAVGGFHLLMIIAQRGGLRRVADGFKDTFFNEPA